MTFRFALLGRRSHRTPLSYTVYQQLLALKFRKVDAFRSPEFLVFGHPDDIQEETDSINRVRKFNPDVKLVVLSEEPFWDLTLVKSVDFRSKRNYIEIENGELKFWYLNHETSNIFHFQKLPYYVTTDDHFVARYRHLISQYCHQSVTANLTRWQNARHQAAFFAEKRTNIKFDKSIESLDIYGLCRFRSMLTYHYDAPGTLKVGRGWTKGGVKRQALPDWHLDKLATLAGRSKLVSALENTHQRHYISEKLFDAYAVGGVPLYYASPAHRVHELVPYSSFVNLFGMTVEDAYAEISDISLSCELAERYLEDLRFILALLTGDALIFERTNVLAKIAKEFECIQNER